MEVFGDFLCPHVCNRLGQVTMKEEGRMGILFYVFFPPPGHRKGKGIKKKIMPYR